MPVRLNITIDGDLREFLKCELPAKGVGRFISDAFRARLRMTRKALDEAYKAADRESWRKAEAREWEATDIEGWPV